MTVNRGVGVRQIGAVGTTPKEHRLVIAGQYAENAPGVPRSGLLTQGATNVVTPTAATVPMTYNVAAVAGVIARTVDEGAYTPTTTGTTPVSTTNAPASGSRWDLIWIKQNDQEKGDADNVAILGVTNGISSATPTRPTGSVPAGALVIAEAQIFSGTTTTTAAPNTVTQVFPITAARGAPIPVRSDAERATITAPAPNQLCPRLDVPGVIDIWDGTAWNPSGWSVILGHMGQTGGGQAISGTPSAVNFTAAQILRGGMVFGAAQKSLFIPRTGLYEVKVGVRFGGSGTGMCMGEVRKNSNVDTGVQVRGYKDAAGEPLPTATETVQFTAGDNVYVVVYGPASIVYGTTGYNGTFLELKYVGQ